MPKMEFRQQQIVTADGAGSVSYGFGCLQGNISLQVSFTDGAGAPITPTAGSVIVLPTNDMTFYGAPLITWTLGDPNNNQDVVTYSGGPFQGVKVIWNNTLSPATNCIITTVAAPL